MAVATIASTRAIGNRLISTGLRPLFLCFAALGCVHRSAEEAILFAFADQSANLIFDRDAQPQYLRFDDPLTASVFKNLTRSGRYRVAPEASSLLCPGVPDQGMHGYVLGARVDTAMGDSAFAHLSMTCLGDLRTCPSGAVCWGSQAIRITTTYLLVRRNGQWKVVKAISGNKAILM